MSAFRSKISRTRFAPVMRPCRRRSERLGEDQDGAIQYRPPDDDHIRELLVALWGKVLTPEAIEDAFERLMDHGEWPHDYCEEDEEDRPLSSYRTEEDEVADWFEAVRAGEIAVEV